MKKITKIFLAIIFVCGFVFSNRSFLTESKYERINLNQNPSVIELVSQGECPEGVPSELCDQYDRIWKDVETGKWYGVVTADVGKWKEFYAYKYTCAGLHKDITSDMESDECVAGEMTPRQNVYAAAIEFSRDLKDLTSITLDKYYQYEDRNVLFIGTKRVVDYDKNNFKITDKTNVEVFGPPTTFDLLYGSLKSTPSTPIITGTYSDDVTFSLVKMDVNKFLIIGGERSDGGIDNNDEVVEQSEVLEFTYILEDYEVDDLNALIKQQFKDEYNNISNNTALSDYQKQVSLDMLVDEYGYDAATKTFTKYNISYDEEISSFCEGDCLIEASREETTNMFMKPFESIVSFFVVGIFIIILVAAFPMIVTMLPTIQSVLVSIFNIIKPLVESIFNLVKDLIVWFINWLSSGLWPVLKENVPKLLEAIKNILISIYEAIKQLLKSIAGIFKKK